MSRPASPTEDEGGGGQTARKLLGPRRRRQIEVWLDEAVRWERLQSCAVGTPLGHLAADLPGPPSPSPSASPSPSPLPPPPPPPESSSASASESSHQGAGVAESRPRPAPSCQVCGRLLTGGDGGGDGRPGRARQVFRGWMSAVGSRRAKGGGGGGGEWDPALSTRMFLVEDAADDCGSSSAASGGLDGSDGGGGKQALDGRMARLRRAQRLLEKSQPKAG